MLHIHRNNRKLVEQLIRRNADVNAMDRLGRTPLHLCKDLVIAKKLIEAGAQADAVDNNGDFPEIVKKLEDD